MCVRARACVHELGDLDSPVIKTYNGRGAGNRLVVEVRGSQVAAAVNLRLLPVSACVCVCLRAPVCSSVLSYMRTPLRACAVCTFALSRVNSCSINKTATAGLQTAPRLSAQLSEGRHSESW